MNANGSFKGRQAPCGKVCDGDRIQIVIDRNRLEGSFDLVGEGTALFGAGGLAVAGALGIRSFVRDLRPRLAVTAASRVSRATLPLFLAFATVLCARVWWLTLPILRGGQ